MADLRIVDAPEIPTENITGEEKLPTGGNGNYSITLDSVADYTKTKKDLADNTAVDGKVNGVRQELDAHVEDLLNPHQVTKGQIGLGNVDNTADADKPVSNSTQATIISAVAPKADKTYVDNQLVLKASKVDVDSSLLTKSDKTYVDDQLALKADKTYVDSQLTLKSDKTYVDSSLLTKADRTYTDSQLALKSDKTYVDSQDLSLQSQIDQKATAAYLDSELAAQTQAVNTALSNLSTVASKFYPTLTEANADIANLEVNQPVQIGESANGGLWYKATAEATTLTKSAYDPLTQAKADATTKANTAEANANLRTGIVFDFYSLFIETQFIETDKNLRIIRSIKKGGVDSTVIEAKDYADQKSKDTIKEAGIIIDFHSYFDSVQFVEVDKEFRVVREIEKGHKPNGSGDGGGGSAVIVLDFYSNFKEKSSALVVISNNNKVLLKMASDGSEIFNANNLKNNVSPDVTHIEHTFLKKRLAEHPIAAKFNYHRSNDGTVANFPSLIQVYEMYDELMSRHSDSMTKITLGTDATGLPIYCYIIKPKPYLAVRFTDEQLKHPKVVISGAVHGDERPAQVGCAVFTAQLLDEHMKRERYAMLRHACEFHIIPAINPWGANNFNRKNSNDVDLNRDFGDGLFTQTESQLMRDYVLSLDNVILFLDMHQSQSPDYLLWLGATRPKSRELTKAFSVESLKYFYANVRPEVTTQYSFQIAANGDNTMCQYFSNQGIESILIESPVSHEAIGDATVVRDFVTEAYAIAINEFYQNFKQTNANAAI